MGGSGGVGYACRIQILSSRIRLARRATALRRGHDRYIEVPLYLTSHHARTEEVMDIQRADQHPVFIFDEECSDLVFLQNMYGFCS